jgi:hypothetical protein
MKTIGDEEERSLKVTSIQPVPITRATCLGDITGMTIEAEAWKDTKG